MIVDYDTTVPSGMQHQIEDAIARCSYPLDLLEDVHVLFTVASEPPCVGHKDYMCTQEEVPLTQYTTTIRQGANDPSSSFLTGLPNPATDTAAFFRECIVHELMHVVGFIFLNTDPLKTQAAGMFLRTQVGEGQAAGTLADWNPTDAEWGDRIQEAFAEAMKDTHLASSLRIYDNRSNWNPDKAQFGTLQEMVLPIAQPETWSITYRYGDGNDELWVPGTTFSTLAQSMRGPNPQRNQLGNTVPGYSSWAGSDGGIAIQEEMRGWSWDDDLIPVMSPSLRYTITEFAWDLSAIWTPQLAVMVELDWSASGYSAYSYIRLGSASHHSGGDGFDSNDNSIIAPLENLYFGDTTDPFATAVYDTPVGSINLPLDVMASAMWMNLYIDYVPAGVTPDWSKLPWMFWLELSEPYTVAQAQ